LYRIAGLSGPHIPGSDGHTKRRYLEEALAIFRELGDRARIGWALGNLCWAMGGLGDFVRASAAGEEAVRIFEELGDRPAVARSLKALGIALKWKGDLAGAREHLGRSLAIYQEHGPRPQVHPSQLELALVAIAQDDRKAARELLDSAVSVYRGAETHDLREPVRALVARGVVAIGDGELDHARALLDESLRAARKADWGLGTTAAVRAVALLALAICDEARAGPHIDATMVTPVDVNDEVAAMCLSELAEVCHERGLHERAARLLGAASNFPGGDGAAMAGDRQAGLIALRDALQADRFDCLWAEGRAMSREEAVMYALRDEEPE
jgi:tetratricopeptide (TPR) repeat protein